jgi:hypothetical protein
MRSFVRRSIPLLGVAVALSLVSPRPAAAGFYRWVMPAGGAWDNGTNWSPSGYPHQFFDFALFDAPGSYVIDATNAAHVPGVGGIMVTSGDVRLSAHSALSGALTLGTLNTPTSLTLVTGGLTASAIHTVAAQATLVLGPGSSLTSTVGGNLGFVIEDGGVLRGDGGSLEHQVLRSFGTVSPGMAPGTTGILSLGRTAAASYEQRSTGVLEIELAGPDPGTGYDRLQVVSGSAPVVLDGTLRVSLLGGYVPDPGSSFDVLTAPAVTGAFASVDLPSLPNRDFTLEIAADRVTVHVAGQVQVAAHLDVQPGGCPNSLGVNKRGVIPVALVGSDGFDVTAVDVSSVLLNGVPPVRSSIEDVTSPYSGDGCGCAEDTLDGVPDLSFKVDAPSLLATLAGSAPGDEVPVTLTGALLDGTPFEASDCVRLVGGGARTFGPELHPLSAPRDATQLVTAVMTAPAPVSLGVYDVAGRRVAQLWSGELPAGERTLSWDASGLPSGLYFYVLQSGAGSAGSRVLILR